MSADLAVFLRTFGAPLAAERVPERLRDTVQAAREATGARAAAFVPTASAGTYDPDGPGECGGSGAPGTVAGNETIADGPFDPAPLADLRARVAASGAAEVDGDTLAAPVEGLNGLCGVLVTQGVGADRAEALVSLLRLAAVAGRLLAFGQHWSALGESVARAHAILETSVDAVITIDETGIMESFNPAAERIFGLSAAEALGRDVNVLMPEPYRSSHAGYLHSYLETGVRKIIGIGREVTGLRADGSVFPMELAVSETWVRGRRIFTGLVRDISDRRMLEQEVLRASEEERARIGQDLHDGLGQMLTGISLIARSLSRKIQVREPEIAEQVAELATMLREADQYARTIARGLVPVDLSHGGLRGALERLATNAKRLMAVTCTVTLDGEVPIEDPTVAVHLYRIAQEAVSNAVRHGGAQHVRIALVSNDEAVTLTIADDGRGFGPDIVDRPDRGAGLRIMHYRARLIDAALDVKSRAGAGTTIVVRFNRDGQTPARSLEEQLRGIALDVRLPEARLPEAHLPGGTREA